MYVYPTLDWVSHLLFPWSRKIAKEERHGDHRRFRSFPPFLPFWECFLFILVALEEWNHTGAGRQCLKKRNRPTRRPYTPSPFKNVSRNITYGRPRIRCLCKRPPCKPIMFLLQGDHFFEIKMKNKRLYRLTIPDRSTLKRPPPEVPGVTDSGKGVRDWFNLLAERYCMFVTCRVTLTTKCGWGTYAPLLPC